jgi:hypothetical protein
LLLNAELFAFDSGESFLSLKMLSDFIGLHESNNFELELFLAESLLIDASIAASMQDSA